MFKKSVMALALSSAGFGQFAYGEEISSSDNEIEVVNVWGTQIKASSMYLNSEDIVTKQADHISDLLRTIPGVDVGGAHSLNQRITIRSMDDKDLKISIDGAAQNTYMFHHMGNLQIHADILKSVDIEVGTNSVINGGLGGAVRFETKQAADLLAKDERAGARISAMVSDNAGHNFSLTGYGLLTDDVDFLIYHNEVDTENYKLGDKVRVEARETISYVDEVIGLEGDIKDTLLKFGWNIDNSQRVALSYETYQDKGNYSARPDMGIVTDITLTYAIEDTFNAIVPLVWPTEFTRDTVTLSYDLQFGEDSQLKATAFSNVSELMRDESAWGVNAGWEEDADLITGEAKNRGVNVLVETYHEFAGVEHDIVYGGEAIKHETEWMAEGIHPDYIGDVQTAGERSRAVAAYIQDTIAITEQFNVIPGIRHEQVSVEANVIHKRYKGTTFSFAAEYFITSDLLVKASATELFRAPELAEVFIGAGTRDLLNAELKEETGINKELSIAYQSNILGADQFSVGITYFNTDIDDYIYDYNRVEGKSGYLKDNIGDLVLDGVEAYLGYSVGNFDSQITFSAADSEINAFTQYQQFDGARIDRQQGDTYGALIKYTLPKIDAFVSWEVLHVQAISDGLNLDGARLSTAKQGFTVHNIAANWHPKMLPGTTIIFGVDNLFDELYASQSSRTGISYHPRFNVELPLIDWEPGRNIKATVAYKF